MEKYEIKFNSILKRHILRGIIVGIIFAGYGFFYAGYEIIGTISMFLVVQPAFVLLAATQIYTYEGK